MRVMFGFSIYKGKHLKKKIKRLLPQGETPDNEPEAEACEAEPFVPIPFDLASRLALAHMYGVTRTPLDIIKSAAPIKKLIACLLLSTVIVTGISLSRYSSGSSTSDSAHLARLEVSVSPADNSQWSDLANLTDDVLISNGMRKLYTFSIINTGEVPVRGKIDVIGNSLSYPMDLYIGALTNTPIPLPDTGYHITLDPGAGTTIYVRIYAQASPGSPINLGNGGVSTLNVSAVNNIEISFSFEQID